MCKLRRGIGACFALHCCNNELTCQAISSMLYTSSSRSNHHRRQLRARLVAWLLLVAQLTSLFVVPLHAIAHGQVAHSTNSVLSASSGTNAANQLFGFFGHEQGWGCDEWSAAFALDSHAGDGLQAIPVVLPPANKISACLPSSSPATPFRQFRARAPPRI